MIADRPAELRSGRGRVAGISDRHHHGPALRLTGDALSDLLFEEIGATFRKLIGGDRDQLRRRLATSVCVLGAGTIDKDKAIEAVEPFLCVTAGPGRGLGPIAELHELRMGRDKSLHCVRVLAPRRAQEFVEGMWR